jgi:hypothetical protein
MEQQIVCLTAGARCGTTALRSLVAETGRFVDFGEVFDPGEVDNPGAFFGFCRKRGIGIADILDDQDAERLCSDYVATLRSLAGHRHVWIDVKFNSWGEIRSPWSFVHQQPFFLTFLKSIKARFVFLWRRDICAQILSDWISQRLDKWHNLEQSDAAFRINLDPEKIREHAELLCRSEEFFFGSLRNEVGAILCSYEHLFSENQNLNPDVKIEISNLVGEKLCFPETCSNRRNSIDARSIVSNHSEIVAIIKAVAAGMRLPIFASQSIISREGDAC